VLCSRCGLDGLPPEAPFCPRCGTPLGGSAGAGSMEHRRLAAVEAFESGREPAGVQCPNCGQYRLQAVRIDADANMVFGFIAFVVGAIALVLVVFGGDVGLYFTNASVLAVGLLIAGVLLLLLARYRRRPKAFECFSCGYRVP
jgi:VIT1/CCC1 family predicted Fe2+/Mn2+ transporter